MHVYTLFYKDTNSYNRSIFVMPTDATAIKAMKLNLMEKNAERFRNECSTGNVELHCIAKFSEYIPEPDEDEFESEKQERINPIWWDRELYPKKICNLKDLLNDNNGNLETTKSDNT